MPDDTRMLLVQVLGFAAGAAVLIWCISAGVRSGLGHREKQSHPRYRATTERWRASEGFEPIVPATPATAESTKGHKKYFVVGVHKESGEDVTIRIDAATEANAKVKGELRGIVVTEVLEIS
jgi:hypothetical protein